MDAENGGRRQRFLRGTEVLLWVIGTFCFCVLLAASVGGVSARRTAAMIIPGQDHSHSGLASGTGSGAALEASATLTQSEAGSGTQAVPFAGKHQAGDVIGRLELPELGLAVPITAGIESASLLRGVGHIEGTAMPGGLGTLGLAGHRDTYFRPLRRIAPGMDVRVIDRTGTYHYAVDSTEIVLPEQVEVLNIQSRPELTLITCYPFDYVGAAPKRFIVHAHLLSAAPDERS